MSSHVPIQAAAAIIFLGGGLLTKAWTSRKRINYIKNFATSTIRGAAMGLVELHGTVTAKQSVTSPLTMTPCAFCMYDIAKRGKKGNSVAYNHMKTAYTGDRFMLTDGTGVVPVDPREATFLLPTTYHYISTKKASEHEKKFLEENDAYTFSEGSPHKKFRVREYILQDGDEIYVMGTAQDNPEVENASQIHGYQDLLIASGNDSDLFFISNKNQNSLVRRLRIWMITGFIFGPPIILLGLGIMFISVAYGF